MTENKKQSLLFKAVRLLIFAASAFLFYLYLNASTKGFFDNNSPSFPAKNAQPEKDLAKTVNFLAVGIGDRNAASYKKLLKAEEHINSFFLSLKTYNVYKQSFETKNRMVSNIIAEKKGSTADILVVGAHYDTCFNPGADDNASGVAGLLELAKGLKDEKFKKTVRFVAFTNEEPPYFQTGSMGSLVYAREAKQKDEKITGVIVLESIGYFSEKKDSQKYPPLLGAFYPNKGNFTAIVGDFSSAGLANKVKKSFKKGTNLPVESLAAFQSIAGVSNSDHWSFWQAGYKAVMVTDTAPLRNPAYHTNADMPITLDYARMAETVKGVRQAIIDLANE